MDIRHATPDDLDAIVPIWWEGLTWSVHDHPASRPALADRDAYRAQLVRLLDGAGPILVATDAVGAIIGHCDLEAFHASTGHYGAMPCAFLHDLDTRPDARRDCRVWNCGPWPDGRAWPTGTTGETASSRPMNA